MSELHPLAGLILARLESHPEEFKETPPYDTVRECRRWDTALEALKQYGSEADYAAVFDKMRLIRLEEAYNYTLDELLNGDERRRREEEDRAYERKMMAQQAAAIQRQTIPLTNQYANAAQLGHPGQFITDYDHATQNMRIKDTHTGAITTVSREQLEDKGLVATMKKALGI